eukprot:TRINITY_DN2069_c0_g1_i1.p1 TRINITY_DN2069_c0_g1~~TRINITY_DN2069_c0_g1_i1.p1  ORF type:complete len:579 (+),score=191.91 TRINITY_DN2069_c0_g1_i1:259-1737(+)
MIINRLEKLFVTNDAATIIRELDIMHPAAKMVVMASEMQEQENGDGTNFVLAFAGELLLQAESLIRMNVHPSDILAGYTKATKKALEVLEELTAYRIDDIKDEAKVIKCIKSAISSKQHGFEDLLSPLIARACVQILPKDPKNFNVENIRVVKILGGGVADSTLVKGFVVDKDAEGTIKHVQKAKIAVFNAGIEGAKPETKGVVLFKNAEQLENFSVGEEKLMENIIKSIADAGINVVVTGGAISELGMHYLERYKIMAVKVSSKFALRRVCKAIGATALVRLGAPTPEETGSCDLVTVEELGSTRVTIFKQEKEDSAISSIVVRASTQNILDDIERTIDDAVNVFKGLCRDPRFVAGGGAVEIELARRLQTVGDSTPGLDQYAIKRYAESFEIVPRILAENAGIDATSVVSTLYASHTSGKTYTGVDVEDGGISDMLENQVLDHLLTKHWGIKFASDVVLNILRIDQMIVAKPAGGPRPPAQSGGQDPDDG